MNTKFYHYLLFWLSQSVSQLGSSMTSFALILWVYRQSQSALSVSLMTFCNYVPYIAAGAMAGNFIDRHRKRSVMLAADVGAALCSAVLFGLVLTDRLTVGAIYGGNAVIGVMNALQQPASAVAVGAMVPRDRLSRASGMASFSENGVQILTPFLAALLFGAGGLEAVLVFDLGSFLTAFLALAFWIRFPEPGRTGRKPSMLSGLWEGFGFLWRERGILELILTMAVMNFCSRLTYENILSPMILARSGKDQMALAAVNGAIGIGGILGGGMATFWKGAKRKIPLIYGSAAASFLLGDVLMGLGRSVPVWCLAGFMASFPLPFVMAGQNVILYSRVPAELQGRVFAARNALQNSLIPLGILSGGLLADFLYEPFMRSGSLAAEFLGNLVGTGSGSGMALMFLCTGIGGCLMSGVAWRRKEIRRLEEEPEPGTDLPNGRFD